MSATCLTCDGEGQIGLTAYGPQDCPDCLGAGECDCGLCESCISAAENAWSDLCESEPPLSMDERHQMAWREKEEIRS